MSFDLIAWAHDGRLKPDAAQEIYESLALEKIQLPADPRVTSFVADLINQFPDVNEDSEDDCVWTDELEISPGHCLMHIQWSHTEAVMEVVRRLVRQHGLICYDPQSSRVFR